MSMIGKPWSRTNIQMIREKRAFKISILFFDSSRIPNIVENIFKMMEDYLCWSKGKMKMRMQELKMMNRKNDLLIQCS